MCFCSVFRALFAPLGALGENSLLPKAPAPELLASLRLSSKGLEAA